MRVRAVALLIQNDSIAVMERYRAGRHYFTFPGGGMDKCETAEEAVVRETREELGVDARALQQVAEVWFNGNQQVYFLVEQTGGTFGTGVGPEFTEPFDPMHGTYHPKWMAIAELLANPVLPVEIAELVKRAHAKGWPEKPVIIYETSK